MSEQQQELRRLDTRIRVEFIIGILVQTVVLVWIGAGWKATTEARIEALEKASAASASVVERLVAIEVQQRFIAEQLLELKTAIKERRNN